jgi:hypothetical protein
LLYEIRELGITFPGTSLPPDYLIKDAIERAFADMHIFWKELTGENYGLPTKPAIE